MPKCRKNAKFRFQWIGEDGKVFTSISTRDTVITQLVHSLT